MPPYKRPAVLAYWGMLLRSANPDDAMEVARVHVRSWQVGYRGLLPDTYLEGLSPEERAARYDFTTVDPRKPRTFVAVDGGIIMGFATTSPARDADLERYGELCALYVDPPHWGKGIGAALITDARARLREMGFQQAALWVLSGNVRAERFYRFDGWAEDGVRRIDSRRGIAIEEVRYQRAL